jgi:uncharacterized protein (DUF305 family)
MHDIDSMPGMAHTSEVAAFRDAHGRDADALFLALMPDHHLGGVAMAEAATESATDAWVADTAAWMAGVQRSEIAEMEFTRNALGLSAQPHGFTSDFDGDETTGSMSGHQHAEAGG